MLVIMPITLFVIGQVLILHSSCLRSCNGIGDLFPLSNGLPFGQRMLSSSGLHVAMRMGALFAYINS